MLTGIVPYDQLGVNNPIAFALQYINQNRVAGFISLGALLGITTVLLVMLYGQTRLFYAMSRGGLLPKILSRINKKTKTSVTSSWITTTMISLFAAIVPLKKLAELTSMGTLFAFLTVSVGIIVLRKKQPNLPRTFKVPFVPWIPALSIICCGYLAIQLQMTTWIGFIIWIIIGIIFYFSYNYKHSKLRNE